MEPVRVGIVGCGRISPAYVKNIKAHFGAVCGVVACADIREEAARERAEELDIPRACTVEELMADDTVELVVDLTNPGAHYRVSMAALQAGKHVFVEKPLTTTLEQGREVLAAAEAKGLSVGGAADTFLGGGLQACRAVVDNGDIGTPTFAQVMFGTGGRHARYLGIYGGPLFDMGSYFVTALVSLFGPVAAVTGMVKQLDDSEMAAAELPSDIAWPFSTPYEAVAVLRFAGGHTASLSIVGGTCSYFPRIEVYGSEATLLTNDPNSYGGRVAVRDKDRAEKDVDPGEGFVEDGRGLGVAEMALAIRQDRQPRTNGTLMFHVLETLHAVRTASQTQNVVQLQSTCDQPEPFDAHDVTG